jgi:ribose transport system permease protein
MADTPSDAKLLQSRPAARGMILRLSRVLLPIALVAMLLGFAAAEPLVLSPGNLLNIVQQASYLAIFAAAQMIVILTRGFDLSLGMCVSSVSVASALTLTGFAAAHPDAMPLVILAGILVGLLLAGLVGAFNGVCVAFLGVNPFIATLGSLNICYGIASTISGGRPVFNVPKEFSRLLYSGTVLGVPVPVTLAVIVIAAIYFVLHHTVFGRSLYLIGGNPRAAHLAGLPSRGSLLVAYVLCSLLAGVGALMLTARTGSGEPNLGGGLTLESIAAAVIGGVSLGGGVGGISAALLGALFITALSNGMNLTRIDGYVQQIILGCVIIAAIFVDRLRASRV